MPKELTVKAHISVPLTTPDRLVTESGSKLPLWAASDDDLRLIAGMMADEMVAKAAEQRSAATATQPPTPPASRYIGLEKGEPADAPSSPADNMHARLHRARMASGPREQPAVHRVEDERAPGKMAAHPRKREE